MIIRTALPLVAELGASVTTSRIARAAGIGEATIFRVFADKDELLKACLVEALRPDHVLAEIGAIPLDQPLADRLAEVADATRAYLERMGAIVGAMHGSGPMRRSGDPGGGGGGPNDRDVVMGQTVEALAALFEPEREQLRVTPAEAAELFLRLTFTRPSPNGTQGLDQHKTIDAFLHGTLKAEPA